MDGTYRYRPVLFFVIAYVVSWVLWLAGAYIGSRPGSEFYGLLFNLLGLIGPIGATLFLVMTSGDSVLKADFRDRLFNLRRIPPAYAFLAIVIPFAVILLSIWLSLWFGESTGQFAIAGSGAGLFMAIGLTMILAPVMEEVGWHGYGVDSLRAHAGVFTATLLFAILWSLWHAPLVLIPGTYQHFLAGMPNSLYLINFFVSVLPAAFIANWLYYKYRRSVTGAVFVHSMLNASAVLLNAGQVAKCIATILYALVAVAIVVGDGMFREGPRDFVHGEADASP